MLKRRWKMQNFNPRSREGSDDYRDVIALKSRNFNPRSREGSDHDSRWAYGSLLDFNPRSREGSDSEDTRDAIKGNYFNPRSREGSDKELDGRVAGRTEFQSTLPRRERPKMEQPTWKLLTISIHAPAKGATGGNVMPEKLVMNFNPRSREGSDTFLVYKRLFFVISIHAPAKGATEISIITQDYLTTFQSTLPRRERQ